ncbi:MAG: hypothetical protein IPG99_15530 [Ignavibacteria bacterium]|nr:hypothetical protein [Ignavibacteria bacterium]
MYPQYRGSLSGSSHHKDFARVAANGGADQKSIYIVYVEKGFSSGYYFNINGYKTSDGINWANMQLAGGGDSNSEIKTPDIIGRRGTEGKFYITNKWVSLKSFTLDHNNQLTGSYKLETFIPFFK